MSAVARAAEAYGAAIEEHRDAKRRFELVLRDARAREGRSVAALARESGYSRTRIYQLLKDQDEGVSA